MPEEPSPHPPARDDWPPTAERPQRWYHRVPTWMLGIVGAVALLLVLPVAAYAWLYTTADIPPPAQLAPQEPSVVYDAAGETVATLDPAAVRKNVELDELPPHVAEATLAAEDRNFHDHGGFSVTAILRAAWANLTSGEVVQGASTIDQQYVSLAVAEIDDSYPGKFREVAVAAKLDDELSKERILEMYLNAVPYGRGARGIEAAAQTYFRVPATELDLNQAATLAGMIAAPSAYDPADNPRAATTRRDYVLEGMAEQGWIEPSRAELTIAQPLPDVETSPLVRVGPDAYFLDAVRDVVPELLDDPQRDVFTDLAIHTTLDKRLQRLAVQSLDEHLTDLPYSGAVTTIDVDDGAVRALVGGLDYREQQFNVATSGTRQAGSSFKPFALTAFVEQGKDPESLVDAPRTVRVPDAGGSTAEIGNYTGRGYGAVTVREATERSINTAYINIADEVGHEAVVATAQRLGITTEIPAVPTAVLGVGDVRPIDMATAYATLAAGGLRQAAHVVTRIEDADGTVLYEREPAPEEVLDPNVAAVVTDVLRGVVESGTGRAATIDRPVAGKTGTTNDYRDAWFVGYTPRFATSVWIGNLDNTPTERVTGGSLPAQIWSTYMEPAVAPTEPLDFPEPDTSALDDLRIDVPVRTDDEADEATEPAAPETTHDHAQTPPQEPEQEPTASPGPQPEPTGGDTGGEQTPPPPEEEPSEEEPTQEPTQEETTQQPSEEEPTQEPTQEETTQEPSEEESPSEPTTAPPSQP